MTERTSRQTALAARASAAGDADGVALVLSQPLSFWGGIDVSTGRIIDRTHPDVGKSVTGAILVMPGGRGSSSSCRTKKYLSADASSEPVEPRVLINFPR